jgi:hypothetical protein
MSAIRRTMVSASALLGLLGSSFALASAASAETQQFTGSGSSFSLARDSAYSMSESAGYADSQCTYAGVTAWDWDDWEYYLSCTR